MKYFLREQLEEENGRKKWGTCFRVCRLPVVGGSIRTGGAINDINATTSKHGSISSQAGGIINNKFRWNTASNKRNPFVCDKLTRRLVRPVCNSRLRAWTQPLASSPSFYHFFSIAVALSFNAWKRSRVSRDENYFLYASDIHKSIGIISLSRELGNNFLFTNSMIESDVYAFLFRLLTINSIACLIWVNENDTLINF